MLAHNAALHHTLDEKEKYGGSHAGMAHFAGTGPVSRQCWQCEHFKSGKKPPKDGLSNGSCQKFRQLTKKKTSQRFTGSALSCKYYEARK